MVRILTSDDASQYSISKTGRTADEIIAESGDILSGMPPPIKTAQTVKSSEISISDSGQTGTLTKEASVYTPSRYISGYSGGQTVYTNPQFYSPIHTPTNWQIPTRRREVYNWVLAESVDFIGDNLTFCSVKNLEFSPLAIVNDTRTSGVIYENVEMHKILSGNGNLKNPIHISERDCNKKRCMRIKASGYWRRLELSEEHNIFIIQENPLRKEIKALGDKLYNHGRGIKGPYPKKKYAETKKWDIKRVRSDQVKSGDFLLTPIPKIKNEVKFRKDNDFFWLVGLCIADGSIDKNGYGISLNCHYNDKNIMENAVSFLKTKYSKCKTRNHTNTEKCIRITSSKRQCNEDFSQFITGKLTDKKFTKEILNLTKEQMLHILGGYFDGDGSFTKTQNKLVANNVSKDMIDQIYFMCLICGISCTLGRYKYTKYESHYGSPGGDWYYRIFIPVSEVHKLRPYMKSGKISEDFKYNGHDRFLRFFTKDEDGNEYLAQRVESVEEFFYTGKGYDLQIEPDHNYTASGFKVSNCRFFSQNDGTIAGAIRFYSEFPFSGYDHVMSDPIRKEHFDKLKRRLRITHWLKLIAKEFYVMGDSFPFISVHCPECGGEGLKRDGTPCSHKDGEVKGISVMNADWIDVELNILDPTSPIIKLVPDDTLKSIVWNKNPIEVYNQIPVNIRAKILASQPIKLSNNSVTHLKHDEIPYQAYGRGIIVPLFPMLAYQDKLRQAQWIVAQRHILPIKVAKVGNDERPAGAKDIGDAQRQLAVTANNPNLTLVTHHAFCHDEKTEVLTKDGWKKYYDVEDSDEIMVFDKDTKEIRYENFIDRFEYHYRGEMICFKGKQVDICVTPNHRMLARKRFSGEEDWEVIEAKDIKLESRFRSVGEWKGKDKEYIEIKVDKSKIKKDFGLNVKENLGKVEIDLFLRFLGYYLSEGCSCYNEKTRIYQVNVAQSKESKCINDVLKTCEDFAKAIGCHLTNFLEEREEDKEDIFQLKISNKCLSYFLKSNFGGTSKKKFIPQWIKELPPKRLSILLESFCNGDAKITETYKCGPHFQVSVYSEMLNEDISEIAYKCGYIPKKENHKSGRTYINFGSSETGKFPKIRKRHLKKKEYDGLVWCFKTKTGFFVTRRNGKITIQGNSLEYIGAAGKVLQLTKEYDLIDKAMIKGLGVNEALLAGTGPSYCFDEKTKLLTQRGFVSWDEFNIEKDKVATYNKDKDSIEYQKASLHNVFDHNSIDGQDQDLYHFKTNRIDFMCTHNHRMLVKKDFNTDKWEVIEAQDIKENMYFKSLDKNYDVKLESTDIEQSILRVPYKGKVWCVTVPNGFIVTQRNGLISIHGNSQAAIGIEATIRRLKTTREMFAEWIYKIYRMEAHMRGYYKEDLDGNKVLDYPDIRWEDLNLRDETQRNSMYMQLWDKKIVSTEFICEKIGIDYDTETERIRWETLFQQQMGIGPGMDDGKGGGGMMGGGFGGGGGGGGMPPPGGKKVPGMGGNMPGGGMAPGLPGDANAPSMSGGEGASGGVPGAGGNMADYEVQLTNYNKAREFVPAVSRPGKFSLREPKKPMVVESVDNSEMVIDDTNRGMFRLTSIERKLYGAIQEAINIGNLPMDFWMQQHPEPVRMPKVSADGMFPSIGLIIEADGKQFHSSQEDIAKDLERDAKLNRFGWTVLRFTEDEINYSVNSVLGTIIQAVKEAQMDKAASSEKNNK